MKNFNGTVKFKQWTCRINFACYQAGNTAILLEDNITGEPIATATINLPNAEPLPPNHVYIKDCSENEGMTKALIDAGVVRFTGKNVPYGNFDSRASMCELLVNPYKEEPV